LEVTQTRGDNDDRWINFDGRQIAESEKNRGIMHEASDSSNTHLSVFIGQSGDARLSLKASKPTDSKFYVCAFSEFNEWCKLNTIKTVKSQNQCFILFEYATDWYSARNDCVEKKGDLAGSNVITLIKTPQNWFPTGNDYWIGVRSSWWSWQINGKPEIQRTYWRSGYPLYRATPTCVAINGFAGEWINVDCLDRNRFICQKSRLVTLMNTDDTFTTARVNDQTLSSTNINDQKLTTTNKEAVIVGLVLGGVILLIVVTLTVMRGCKARQKRKSERRSEIERKRTTLKTDVEVLYCNVNPINTNRDSSAVYQTVPVIYETLDDAQESVRLNLQSTKDAAEYEQIIASRHQEHQYTGLTRH